ncbi:MAG: hypothetical protein HZA53_10820, partial [Planctomycetes bacterium]|nr:hypothetical protein [Planctomycetota bacterium]
MHALLASAPASASVLGFESTEALLPALVRVLAAGLGAGFLARVLGRSPRGAAFAALATAAGALFLRADEHGALQGLAAFPWMLLGLELGRRAEERVARVLWVAVVAAAFVFGAHAPEEGTRVFLALAGLAWCARGVQSGAAERANGLDGFVAVLCGFLASCVLEGAPSMERAEANARAVERVIQGRADPLLLAIVVVAALVAHRWRALARTDEKTRGSMLLGAAGVVLAFGAWLWIADARGASGAWRGLFTGAGALALPVIGLALAVLFDPKAAAGAPRALVPLAAVAGL